MSTEEHAKLSPSGSSRWIACPPSVDMEEAYDDEESEAAAEGTLAHSLAELLIRNHLGRVEKYFFKARLREIQEHPLYTKAMLMYMELFASYAIMRYHEVLAVDPTATIHTEERVNMNEYAPDSFGTVDIQIIGKDLLIIIDLKYGKGVAVFAAGNTQLRMYGLGALINLPHRVKRVQQVIYQPRLESITEEELSAEALLDWGVNVLKPAALKAYLGLGIFTAGSHCRFCSAKAECKPHYDYLSTIFKYMADRIEKLTPTQVSEILDKAEDLKRWLTAVTDYALAKAIEGKEYPRYKVVRAVPRRVIQDEAKAASILLTDAMLKAKDIYKPRQLINIGDLEATLGKTQFKELLEKTGVCIKPEGKPVLALATDKRPALNKSGEAVDDFKKFITP